MVDGPSTAQLTVVAAFDFACPHCTRMQGPLDELVRAYRGRARVVYKAFVLRRESSEAAHLAACAAGKQGKFRAFADALRAEVARSGPSTGHHVISRACFRCDRLELRSVHSEHGTSACTSVIRGKLTLVCPLRSCSNHPLFATAPDGTVSSAYTDGNERARDDGAWGDQLVAWGRRSACDLRGELLQQVRDAAHSPPDAAPRPGLSARCPEPSATIIRTLGEQLNTTTHCVLVVRRPDSSAGLGPGRRYGGRMVSRDRQGSCRERPSR
jgi:hypothetical protein